MTYHKNNKEKGSVVAIMLIVSIIVTILGMSMLTIGSQVRVRAIKSGEQTAARVAADAGLTKAQHTLESLCTSGSLDKNDLPSETDVSLPNFAGTFSYTISEDSDEYTITSEGDFNGSRKTVYTVLQIRGKSPYQHAVLGVQGITIKNNAVIQGYDSSDSLATGLTADIGTLATDSGSITIGNSTVKGDAVVGVGGDPDDVIDSSGTIEGEQYALDEDMELPEIPVPALVDKATDLEINSNTTLGPGESGLYGDLVLNSKKTLTISGGDVVLYVEDVTFGNKGTIKIKNGASLTLFVEGDMTGKNGNGFITESLVPSDCKFITKGAGSQSLYLKNNTDLHMAMYAPNADFEIKNNGDLYGSYTTKNFEAKNNLNVYYDHALLEEDISQSDVEFVVTQWSEN